MGTTFVKKQSQVRNAIHMVRRFDPRHALSFMQVARVGGFVLAKAIVNFAVPCADAQGDNSA